jgi:TolB-like protein/tetratricopeptide (TPR) repeat protein
MADGLAEELAAELGRACPDRLIVIGRASAASVRRGGRPWPEVSRQLDVDYVVRGSVRRSGGRVRASVQLARGADEGLAWTVTVDVDGAGVQQVQQGLAGAIADRVRVRLSERPAATPPQSIDADAHAALLEGRHFLRQRTASSMVKARAAFERALAIEPRFARAYVGAAHSHAFALAGMGPRNEALARAQALVDRALSLDDRLAEAHAVLGVLQSAGWCPADAERSFRWAIALDPSEPSARHWLAMFPLVMSGRYEEALEELRRARRLDPLSLIIGADIGGVYCMTRQFERAITQCTACLHLDANFARAHVYLGWARLALGRHDAAVVALETAARLDRSPWTMAWLGHAYGTAGRADEARAVLRDLADGADTGPGERPFFVGVVHAGIGQVDDALRSFERAVAERSFWVACLEALPTLDGLRSDARFQTLARCIRLAAWPDSTRPN